MKLTANFRIRLSKPFFFSGQKKEISLETDLDNFHDKITLVPMEDGHQSIEDGMTIFCINAVVLSVSAEEDAPPPFKKADGSWNDQEVGAYLDARTEKYAKHAQTIIKRLTLFFKYEQRNPLLNLNVFDISGLYNIGWTDEFGQEIEPSIRCFVLERIEGLSPDSRYGLTPLSYGALDTLKKAIENERDIEIYEELLSDAQAAILQKNPRRALLELAIACEVAIKQKFFKKKTPAGDAFEYLEDSKRVQVSALELIHGVAEQAFCSSFKKSYPSEYQNIDFLFRCRNKIAHRGEIKFKDDKGVLQNVDNKIIQNWWRSVETLFNWLKQI